MQVLTKKVGTCTMGGKMATDNILELNNITKVYPGVKALEDVTISFRKGEVHALLGENGAGKSTLIKILTGAITPNGGEIILDGISYSQLTPTLAIDLGISAIYQEFNLIPFLSVAENVFYGREIVKGPFIDKAKMNSLTLEYCKEMGVTLNPKSLVSDLGVAYQQIVEIVKCVSQKARILIMDEPSAPLTKNEIEAMFRIVAKLKQNGVTIIYISHRLEEIFEICDRVSIMRDGKYIATKNVKDITRKDLIVNMVGRELGEVYPCKTDASKEVILEVENLYTSKLKNISFQLKKQEILGFGGLVGAGRTELARAIFGADKIISGKIRLHNKCIQIRSPKDAINHCIGLLPEDRKQHGLILGLSIKENITFGILDKISTNSFIRQKHENNLCEKLKIDLKIKTPDIMQKAKNLSGGNQQKVVLSKWLAMKCDVLIFDEPTRGIDIGAKQEIYRLLKDLAESGISIIMISSEMPELIGMSDRIIVMHEGKITGELSKEEYSQEKILELASGN